MEFFRIINRVTNEQSIRNKLEFKNLELISSQLFLMNELNGHKAEIGSLWGEFTLARQDIKGGLRFSLLECPNALTWTVTTGYEPAPEGLIIHLTINRTEKDQDFIEEIEEFLDDHSSHLQNFFDAKG